MQFGKLILVLRRKIPNQPSNFQCSGDRLPAALLFTAILRTEIEGQVGCREGAFDSCPLPFSFFIFIFLFKMRTLSCTTTLTTDSV